MDKPRWHYRFMNFSRALARLQEAAERDTLGDLEMEGFVQRFQYAFEMAWKLLKDHLEHDGIVFAQITPRAVIKAAFAAKLIEDGDAWTAMLSDRNDMSHNYDEEKFNGAVDNIYHCHLPALDALYRKLNAEFCE